MENGEEISSLAKSRGHVISCVSSSKNPAKKLNLRNIDIAIEFSTPETHLIIFVMHYKIMFL